MKTTLAILMLLGLASAHAASIYLHDGEIVRVQRDWDEVYTPEQYETRIDVAETDQHLAKLNGEWASFAVVGTNITYNGELVEWEAIPQRIPPMELLQTASSFRSILRLHFGAGAETNRDVTAQAVTTHFVTRRLTLPPAQRLDDASDGMLLTQGFESIIAWTGDGTIWTFPWHMLPEAP